VVATISARLGPHAQCADKHLRPPNGPEWHRRFYLAVNPRPWSARAFPPWQCPVWRIADERAGIAISTRMTRSGPSAAPNFYADQAIQFAGSIGKCINLD